VKNWNDRIKNYLEKIVTLTKDTKPVMDGTFDSNSKAMLDKMFGRRGRDLIEKIFSKK